MHKIIVTLAVVLLSTGSLFASDKADILETITQFMNAVNRGDVKTATAYSATEMTIIEQFPRGDGRSEHKWQGKKAFAQWFEYYKADANKNGLTGMLASIGKLPGDSPIMTVIDNTATTVVIMRYGYKQNGKPMEEPYWTITCCLLKPADHWVITLLARGKH